MHQPIVLLVDDHKGTRESFAMLLEMDGYVVRAVASADEGLAALRTPPRPSVIVLDICMPDMDGNAFLRVLRADADLSTIPVIIMSAAQNAAEPELPFLLKPTHPDALSQLVRQYCQAD